MKAIYLVGPMACGKSTTMAHMMDLLGLGTGEWVRLWPSTTRSEFRGEPLEDIVTGEVRGLYLGRTRGEFSGTDALGLACHPEALAWTAEAPEWPELILGEGQRLGTAGIFAGLAARSELTVAHLTAPQAVLDERCERRWASQVKVFRSGKVIPAASSRKNSATRSVNVAAGARAAGIRVLELDTSEHDPLACARLILESAKLIGETTSALPWVRGRVYL